MVPFGSLLLGVTNSIKPCGQDSTQQVLQVQTQIGALALKHLPAGFSRLGDQSKLPELLILISLIISLLLSFCQLFLVKRLMQ